MYNICNNNNNNGFVRCALRCCVVRCLKTLLFSYLRYTTYACLAQFYPLLPFLLGGWLNCWFVAGSPVTPLADDPAHRCYQFPDYYRTRSFHTTPSRVVHNTRRFTRTLPPVCCVPDHGCTATYYTPPLRIY